MRLLLVLVLLAAAGAVLLAGRDADLPGAPSLGGSEPERERAGRPRRADGAGKARTRRGVRRARCPADLENCSQATGRVVYVEAVDPDGDGDAHYVLSGGSITAPGMSVIDVPRDLRPKRLPRIGDQVSAAGPVYTGSFGQRQIEAIEVHHHPRR